MPRRAGHASAEDVILQAVESVVERASAGIARAISEILSARIDEELRAQVARAVGKGRKGRRGKGRGSARPEIDRWVADRRARRVPNFVIEQTGLKTKKQIVAKYGENAAFEKGKAAPKAK
jgi:DNA invertase Pin-like site-specific DNA recombinase